MRKGVKIFDIVFVLTFGFEKIFFVSFDGFIFTLLYDFDIIYINHIIFFN
jgi:hypothetical protein